MGRMLDQTKKLAIELYSNGFTADEVARETRYSPATISSIVRSAVANGEIPQAEVSARLEQGLQNYILYTCDGVYLAADRTTNSAVEAFGRIKLPQIIRQVLRSIALDDFLRSDDPYQDLLLEICYGGKTSSSGLAEKYFYAYRANPPADTTVAELMEYLRNGVISSFRERLKVPVYVDKDGLEAALKGLPPREEDVLRRKFFKRDKLEAIAKDYPNPKNTLRHLTRERIRQIKAKALERLRGLGIFDKYSTPERFQEYTRSLEGTVTRQEIKLAEQGQTIKEYTMRFGPLTSNEQRPISEDEQLRRKLYKRIDEIVDETKMSTRSYICLKNANIRTMRELVQKTESELLKTKNFGRKSLNEIKGILNAMGLELGMKLPDNLL